MARHQATTFWEHHGPWQHRISFAPPQLTVDEVTYPTCCQARGHTRRNKVSDPQPSPLALPSKDRRGHKHTQHTTMKTHATLPHREHFQRVRRVIQGFVKQAITQAPTQHHAHHAVKQNVFNVLFGPRAQRYLLCIRRMLQAQSGQAHKQGKCSQVRQAIPMDGQGPQLQGDRIDRGV